MNGDPPLGNISTVKDHLTTPQGPLLIIASSDFQIGTPLLQYLTSLCSKASKVVQMR